MVWETVVLCFTVFYEQHGELEGEKGLILISTSHHRVARSRRYPNVFLEDG